MGKLGLRVLLAIGLLPIAIATLSLSWRLSVASAHDQVFLVCCYGLPIILMALFAARKSFVAAHWLRMKRVAQSPP